MANRDAGFGFAPHSCPHGGGGQPVVEYFDLTSSNSEIGVNTPVIWSSGVIDRASGGAAVCGVAAEYKGASSSDTKIAVWSDPQQRFIAQTDDGTGTATSIGAVGANGSFTGTGVSNRRSTAEIDEDTVTTTATLELKLLGLWDGYRGTYGQKNAYGEFNVFVVKWNNHQFQAGTGTLGT